MLHKPIYARTPGVSKTDIPQAERWGNGGFCYQNPFSAYGYARQPQLHYQRNR